MSAFESTYYTASSSHAENKWYHCLGRRTDLARTNGIVKLPKELFHGNDPVWMCCQTWQQEGNMMAVDFLQFFHTLNRDPEDSSTVHEWLSFLDESIDYVVLNVDSPSSFPSSTKIIIPLFPSVRERSYTTVDDEKDTNGSVPAFVNNVAKRLNSWQLPDTLPITHQHLLLAFQLGLFDGIVMDGMSLHRLSEVVPPDMQQVFGIEKPKQQQHRQGQLPNQHEIDNRMVVTDTNDFFTSETPAIQNLILTGVTNLGAISIIGVALLNDVAATPAPYIPVEPAIGLDATLRLLTELLLVACVLAKLKLESPRVLTPIWDTVCRTIDPMQGEEAFSQHAMDAFLNAWFHLRELLDGHPPPASNLFNTAVDSHPKRRGSFVKMCISIGIGVPIERVRKSDIFGSDVMSLATARASRYSSLEQVVPLIYAPQSSNVLRSYLSRSKVVVQPAALGHPRPFKIKATLSDIGEPILEQEDMFEIHINPLIALARFPFLSLVIRSGLEESRTRCITADLSEQALRYFVARLMSPTYERTFPRMCHVNEIVKSDFFGESRIAETTSFFPYDADSPHLDWNGAYDDVLGTGTVVTKSGRVWAIGTDPS